jgi:hypothetical protein
MSMKHASMRPASDNHRQAMHSSMRSDHHRTRPDAYSEHQPLNLLLNMIRVPCLPLPKHNAAAAAPLQLCLPTTLCWLSAWPNTFLHHATVPQQLEALCAPHHHLPFLQSILHVLFQVNLLVLDVLRQLLPLHATQPLLGLQQQTLLILRV